MFGVRSPEDRLLNRVISERTVGMGLSQAAFFVGVHEAPAGPALSVSGGDYSKILVSRFCSGIDPLHSLQFATLPGYRERDRRTLLPDEQNRLALVLDLKRLIAMTMVIYQRLESDKLDAYFHSVEAGKPIKLPLDMVRAVILQGGPGVNEFIRLLPDHHFLHGLPIPIIAETTRGIRIVTDNLDPRFASLPNHGYWD